MGIGTPFLMGEDTLEAGVDFHIRVRIDSANGAVGTEIGEAPRPSWPITSAFLRSGLSQLWQRKLRITQPRSPLHKVGADVVR